MKGTGKNDHKKLNTMLPLKTSKHFYEEAKTKEMHEIREQKKERNNCVIVLCQFVLKSIRTHFGQFVLSFRSIRTHLIKFSQLVLISVDSYSVWSIRTHTKNMIMILVIYIILLMIDR